MCAVVVLGHSGAVWGCGIGHRPQSMKHNAAASVEFSHNVVRWILSQESIDFILQDCTCLSIRTNIGSVVYYFELLLLQIAVMSREGSQMFYFINLLVSSENFCLGKRGYCYIYTHTNNTTAHYPVTG